MPGAEGSIPDCRAGIGLVEVMVGCLILGVLAVTAASYVYHTSRRLTLNRNCTAAMVAMNSRLEELRAMEFATLTNQLAPSTVIINGITTVTSNSLLSLARANDALLITVEARYRGGPNDVWMTNRTRTICAP
jgi:Tfp pilus assembly protein PilE